MYLLFKCYCSNYRTFLLCSISFLRRQNTNLSRILLTISFFSFTFSLFAGLKKFLAQYPSIFLIEGDHVVVNNFEKPTKDDTYGTIGTRDYIQESKDYFKHKLLQYGIGTEVPIKSLLGHRSQASPQIRHISGI